MNIMPMPIIIDSSDKTPWTYNDTMILLIVIFSIAWVIGGIFAILNCIDGEWYNWLILAIWIICSVAIILPALALGGVI